MGQSCSSACRHVEPDPLSLDSSDLSTGSSPSWTGSEEPSQRDLKQSALKEAIETGDWEAVGQAAAMLSASYQDTASKVKRRQELRQEVEDLVRRVVPEEIQNVDEMMSQFKRREEELIETLRTMEERAVAHKARQSALDEAIEAGDWEAVGQVRAMLSDHSLASSVETDEIHRLADGLSSAGSATGSDKDNLSAKAEEMAREAAEANAAAEAARKAEQAAQEHERQVAAQKLWEAKKTGQLKDQVNQKIISHLQLIATEAKATVQSDWRDQQLLKLSKETIAKEMDELTTTIQNLEENISVVESKTVEIEQWLEENNKSSNIKELTVDELCQPDSKLYAQMLDLSSENAAITDALYFLDRGMYMGHIDCTTHLKSVRKLAKRQFLVRAHLMKINQVLIQKGRS